jgi:hypothetical protein
MMNAVTMNKLKMLDAQHPKQEDQEPSRLKVYYGFSKINKIQKREAIQVVFENERGAGYEGTRSEKTLRKIMNIVTERWQTPGEAADAAHANRMFTSYLIFLDDKKVGGSIKKALYYNSQADKNNVSEKERKEINEKLERFFLSAHRDYKEPPCIQLELF